MCPAKEKQSFAGHCKGTDTLRAAKELRSQAMSGKGPALRSHEMQWKSIEEHRIAPKSAEEQRKCTGKKCYESPRKSIAQTSIAKEQRGHAWSSEGIAPQRGEKQSIGMAVRIYAANCKGNILRSDAKEKRRLAMISQGTAMHQKV